MLTLREAIMSTFARRSTAQEDRFVLFSKKFTDNTDKAEQWSAFLRRSRLGPFLTIADAMARLEAFIEPVCSGEAENKAVWNPAQWRWTPTKE